MKNIIEAKLAKTIEELDTFLLNEISRLRTENGWLIALVVVLTLCLATSR